MNNVACRWAMVLLGVLVVVISGPAATCEDKLSDVFAGSTGDVAYKVLSVVRDREHRLGRLKADAARDICDVEALAGMPEAYLVAVSEYAKQALLAIGAKSMSRRRYFNSEVAGQPPYPLTCHPVDDGDLSISVTLLPRPEAVSRWSASAEGRVSKWRPMDEALRQPGSVYGRTIVFDAGSASKNPTTTPALPHEVVLSRGLFVYNNLFLRLGKVVTSPSYGLRGELEDVTARLGIGSADGAQLRAEVITTPPNVENSRLRWVSVNKGEEHRHFLAYSLIDGNGARRENAVQSVTVDKKISAFVRPLKCSSHQPSIGQHDSLLLPSPLAWPESKIDLRRDSRMLYPREDWCLDDWFPAQKDACWVIREADDSKPLQESFLLMPASEKSDRPVFFIALFAETEPKQLLKELAALYNVSADKALNSPETMARLNSLYEKVRDFPLDQ